MRIEFDEWLSNIVECSVFKLTLEEQECGSRESELLEEKIREIPWKNGAFYYAKVPTRRIDQVLALTEGGFRVVDVNVTFRRDPNPQLMELQDAGILVRDSCPGDDGPVLAMASTCFTYSRFHLDPHIPRNLANEVKRAWVESYCQKSRGERLLVAESEGKVVGFLAFLRCAGSGNEELVIDLVGVDKSSQGQGVGRNLVKSFMNCAVGRDLKLRVGTQVANIPSIRLYESLGFCTSETSYVLHAHSPGRKIQT